MPEDEKAVEVSPVWEEALVQEFVYLIGHLNHSEQHLLEADAYLGRPAFGDLVDRLRECRKIVGQALFEIEALEARGGGGDFRTSWESVWCTLKHLATALIHTDEVIEKVLKKAKSGQQDLEAAARINSQLQSLLEARKSILDSIEDLVARAKALSGSVDLSSVRCREDLCLEENDSHEGG